MQTQPQMNTSRPTAFTADSPPPPNYIHNQVQARDTAGLLKIEVVQPFHCQSIVITRRTYNQRRILAAVVVFLIFITAIIIGVRYIMDSSAFKKL